MLYKVPRVGDVRCNNGSYSAAVNIDDHRISDIKIIYAQ